MKKKPWDVNKIKKVVGEKPEKDEEHYLVKMAKDIGGWPIKLVIFSAGGWPDRTILMPGGKVFFVEVKKEGERVKKGSRQEKVLTRLSSMGFFSVEVNCRKEINQVIDHIKGVCGL